VRTDSAERSDMLDTLLWTYDDRSFLPHAQAGDGDPNRQPVLISVEEANLNRAEIVFYVGGVLPGDWRALKDLVRVVLLFDGRDGEALAGARAAWKEARAAGHDVTYWKESPSGKFEKQG
jgi:DNA polymerase-3 subunit chi